MAAQGAGAVRRVGLIGLGTMGLPMARNLVKAGFELSVYDRREEPAIEMEKLGARRAASIRDLTEAVEVVEIAVSPDEEVERVVLGPDGILSAAKSGLVIDIHSSNHAATQRHIAEEAARKGVDVLDAPMSGGRGVAEGTLVFMVGGDAAVLERCRAIMLASGTNVLHVGGVGMGAMAKMLQNTMLALNVLAVGEGFALATKVGFEPEAFQDLIKVSAAQSHIADYWLERRAHMESPVSVYRGTVAASLDIAKDFDLELPMTMLALDLANKAPARRRNSE